MQIVFLSSTFTSFGPSWVNYPWWSHFSGPTFPQLLGCGESCCRGPRRQFWGNEDQQFIFDARVVSASEKPPQPRSVSQIRNAPFLLPEIVLQDPAQHEGFSRPNQDVGTGCAPQFIRNQGKRRSCS